MIKVTVNLPDIAQEIYNNPHDFLKSESNYLAELKKAHRRQYALWRKYVNPALPEDYEDFKSEE